MIDWENLPYNGTMTGYNEPMIQRRADPFVCRGEDGTYYFTGSYPAYDRILLRSASTLQGLKDAPERLIWMKHEAGPMSEHIWAPELHIYRNGKKFLILAGKAAPKILREDQLISLL